MTLLPGIPRTCSEVNKLPLASWRSRAGPRPGYPDTLTTCGNLARWTGQAGDPAAARDLFAALLPAFERVLGPEHPDTLTTRGNLTYWAERAGRGP